jgi:hypothetical protein
MSVTGLAQSLICCIALIQGFAAADTGPEFKAMKGVLVAVKTQFRDGRVRRGQAFAVGIRPGGIVLVTANSIVRSDQSNNPNQPNNPTLTVQATTRREGFEEPESDLVSLAELRDPDLNLGVLYSAAEVHSANEVDVEWPQTACTVSEVPTGSEVTILRRDGITGEVYTVAGRVLQGFDTGRAVVQIPGSTQHVEELMGAPVMMRDTFTGMVIEQHTRDKDVLLSLISSSEIGRFLARYLIRLEFEPSVDCFYGQLPLGSNETKLRQSVKQALAEKHTWREIQGSFVPNDADLVAMFGAVGVQRAQKQLSDHLSVLVTQDPPPISDGVMTKCYEVTQKTAQEDRKIDLFDPPIELQPKPGVVVLACSVTLQTSDPNEGNEHEYELPGVFLFINGHWVWLY